MTSTPPSPHTMNWDDVRIFLAYMRHGSVQGAADELSISAPTVSRRISALQEDLSYPLVKRTPYGTEVLASAQRLVEMWREAEVLLNNAPALASRLDPGVRVELRFSTTPALATALVFPHLRRFLDRWPNLMLDVDTSYRIVDIGAGQGDIALRFAEPGRGNVIRRKVGELAFSVFAARSILPENFSIANTWEELRGAGLRAITWAPGASVSMPQEKLRQILGDDLPSVSITEFSGLIEAIRNGLGVGILPDVVGARLEGVSQVTNSELVGKLPLWLVTSDRLARYPHVMAFRDFIHEVITEENDALRGAVESARSRAAPQPT